MKRKMFFVMVSLIFCAVGAIAQPEFRTSIGYGGYFTSDFGGGLEISEPRHDDANHQKTPYEGGGAFIFFDATYIEANLGVLFTSGEWKFNKFDFRPPDNVNASTIGLDIGLMVKYPFAISDRFSMFPLFGITYRSIHLLLPMKYFIYENAMEFSTFWFKLGGGLDYSFNDDIYLRTGITYGIRLINKYEKEWASIYLYEGSTKYLLGHGLEVKLAIGFRIKK